MGGKPRYRFVLQMRPSLKSAPAWWPKEDGSLAWVTLFRDTCSWGVGIHKGEAGTRKKAKQMSREWLLENHESSCCGGTAWEDSASIIRCNVFSEKGLCNKAIPAREWSKTVLSWEFQEVPV